MSKTEINKQIVSMRQTVRRVRLCVVRKLIKEIKMLRSKHGTEKQRQKCQRKANRLSEEVLAIKKVKDDDISKFAITNATSRPVSADQNSDANVRVMIRLACHKILLGRIIEFKEKFPNYKEHLGPGRKKLMTLKWKAEKKLKKGTMIKGKEEQESGNDREEVTNNLESNGFSNDNSDENENIADVKSKKEPTEIGTVGIERAENDDGARAEYNLESNGTIRIKSTNLKTKVKETISVKNKCVEKLRANRCNEGKVRKELSDETELKSKVAKTVNKEATVKRFTELLQDENLPCRSHETIETESTSRIELEKEVDSFFTTGNGESEYLSVVVPRSKAFEEDSNDDTENERYGSSRKGFNGHKFSNDRNKFFTKLDRYSSGDEKFKHDRSGNERNDWPGNVGGYEEWRSRKEFGHVEKFKGEKRDESVHPSWEAKKKQQEILKQGFQGKKIVFNDD